MRIDEAVLHEFLHTDYPRLVAAVALIAGSRPAAEDAVQEAMLRAWERSERGQEIDSLRAWVTTVSLNLARSGRRRARAERRARSRSEEPDSADPSRDTERRLDVRRALEALPTRQREVAVLRYYLQLDTREAAATLGVSEGTVKSTLARARVALADALGIEDTLDIEEANDRGRR